ncbi:MAG: WD40 repeat domain-containing protein, partial [Planctomycetota bacterium]
DSPVVSTLTLSDDGKTLAVAHGKSGASGEIVTYLLGKDNNSATPIFQLKAHNDLIQSLSFSPDGKLLASCSYDRLVKIWSIPEGKLIQELKDHSDSVYAVAFNKDGTMLASTGADRAIKVWDTKTWKKLHALSDSTDWVYTLAWSPVKNQLLGAGVDQTLRIWALEKDSSKLIVSAYAHTSGVTKAVWTSDGTKIVSIGEDKIWKIWNADKLSEIKAFKPLSDTPLALGLSPDGLTTAIARVDGKLDLFDLKTGDSIRPLVPFMEPKALLKSFAPTYSTLGKKVTIAIKADHFEAPFVASSNMKGVTLSSFASSPNSGLSLDVQIDANASPGVCKINCKSSKGQVLEIDLEVDRFLRIAENEPNDSSLTGQALALPISVKSSLQRPGDCDWFYIDAQAGQEIAVQLQSEKDDKIFAPMLQMIAPDGTVVAESAQGWLAHVCSQKGKYAIEVRDRDYRGGETLGSYRLHVGSFPIVTSVFPLGAQIGKENTWLLQGVGLA